MASSVANLIPDLRVVPSVSLAGDWAFRHLDRFSPFDGDDSYCPARAKPFIELAIMLGVYAAVTGDTTSPRIQSAARLFQAASRRADFTDWAVRFPADIVNYAELCAAINELNGDAEELRYRLQSAVDAGVLAQIERMPHRLLELRAALDWAGIEHALPSADEICGQTIVRAAPSASLLADSSIYAITHVILFASRFGLTRAAVPDWMRSGRIRNLLCDLLVVTGQARNWDLLGELLLCWDCMGFQHDLVTSAGWASFLDAFRADGAVPPRAAPGAEHEDQSEDIPDREADFGRVYHTTLVAVLAGTLLLSRSGRPVPVLAADDGGLGRRP